MGFKLGMFFIALAFLPGVLLVQQLAVLPADFILLLLLLVCLGLLLKIFVSSKNNRQYTTLTYTVIFLFLLGFIYSSFYAKQSLERQLSEQFVGQNIIIEGDIYGLPVVNDKVQRFEFTVKRYRLVVPLMQNAGDAEATFVSTHDDLSFPKKIRLSWYYGSAVNAGDKWQLQVRLKPPHGFITPGAFDYEAWLFQHGVQATGYVRKSSLNNRIQVSTASVNYFRQALAEHLDALAAGVQAKHVSAFSLVKALAIGDKSSISQQQWQVLRNTGTSHLMAISGLHIGLASLFGYVLIRRLVPVVVMKKIPAQHIALVGGMLAAFLYALIAGLSIPTQRAVIMLFVLSLMLLIRRNHRPIDALGLALVLVLLIDPLAVLSAGFWFSFSAVAVIFISITRGHSKTLENEAFWHKLFASLRVILKQWIRLQLLISIFLLPLSLFMFQQVSLVSPLVNLLLIPYVSFLVVPVVLLAIIFFFVQTSFSAWLFALAASLLDFIWPVMTWFSSLPFALWVRGDVSVITLLAVTTGMLLLFYTKPVSNMLLSVRPVSLRLDKLGIQWSLRLVAAVLCSSLFFPMLLSNTSLFADGEYQLTVLDVGQGSAAVIRTQNHVLVFDAGAKFSERLNVGTAVVIPYLRNQGVTQLDRLIISHGDADHIGGAQAILDEYPEALLIGQDIEPLLPSANRQTVGQQSIEEITGQFCSSGMQWQWDGVDFVFLWPEHTNKAVDKKYKRNNLSCVLQVSSKFGSVLLTGDIEKKAELQLLRQFSEQLQSDILIVPHHGSNTSSLLQFITAVNPKISLISVGYKNKYGLPNARVLARYSDNERKLWRTDRDGAISIKLVEGHSFKVQKYREKAARYWHHKAVDK